MSLLNLADNHAKRQPIEIDTRLLHYQIKIRPHLLLIRLLRRARERPLRLSLLADICVLDRAVR